MYPGAFVRILGLFHSFRVLEFIHVSLELFHILGQLPVLAQLILKHVDERLERRFREFVVTTCTGMKLRRRANRQHIVRRVDTDGMYPGYAGWDNLETTTSCRPGSSREKVPG